jgi:hypothetical protein
MYDEVTQVHIAVACPGVQLLEGRDPLMETSLEEGMQEIMRSPLGV